ncbi:winged helix-turn-helix transcriptional regulator [Pseudomonas psychrophila]|uniref:Helix-turn-helix transcriptional regulator n=1 Tax=Pseudomonas psychrophila TaxID=122355 RepID=A0A8I1FSM4_9PSED|nr:helix-turn-helix domain-containing protein [Pseudomonas psychrophila]MBJ2260106.1 helix-turn-helix transcriptional regulator [Pseudomonas psychrophila]
MCRRVADVLALVGGKWSILVVMTLRSGSLRFNELTRAVNGISQRMLTITLRVLERDGFVKRTVYPTPIRVEYELTSLGEGFSLSVGQLGRWVFNNLGGCRI